MKIQHVIFLGIFSWVYLGLSARTTLIPVEEIVGVQETDVYKVIQDQHGVLWFATDDGIVRWDGITSDRLGVENGLPRQSVFSLFEDPDEGVFLGMQKEMVLVDGDSIKNLKTSFEDNFFIVSKLGNRKYAIRHSAGKVISICTLDQNGLIPTGDTLWYYMDCGLKNDVFFKENECKHLADFDSLYIKLGTTIHSRFLETGEGLGTFRSYFSIDGYVVYNSGEVYFLGDYASEILTINPFLEDVNTVYYANWIAKDVIGIGTDNGFFQVHLNHGQMFGVEHLLVGTQCSGFVYDRESGLWITTIGDGVYHSPKFSLIEVDKEESPHGDRLYLSDSRRHQTYTLGEVYFDQNKIEIDRKNKIHKPQSLTTADFWPVNSSTDFAATDTILSGLLKKIVRTTDSSFVFSTLYNVVSVEGNSNGLSTYTHFLGRSNAFDATASGVVFERNGHLEYSSRSVGGSYVFHFNSHDTLSVGSAVDLMIINKEYLLVAFPSTIRLIHHDQGLVRKVDELPLANVKKMFSIEDKLLLVGDELLTVTRFSEEDLDIIMSFDNLFFGNSDILHAEVAEDSLFVYTEEGVYQLSQEEAGSPRRGSPFEIRLKDVTIDGELRQNTINSVQLKPNEVTLDLDFGLSTPSNLGLIAMSHVLVLDGDTIISDWRKDARLSYINLGEGKYRLYSGIWDITKTRYTEELTVIDVRPPIWKTTAFQIAVVLLTVLVIIVWFRWRLGNIKRKQLEKMQTLNQLNNLKMQALQSQMNPHFIFNSLTSIQISIDNGDVEPAKDYLTKFARLLRRILESSRSGKIVLREEIELLEWYIKLETSRFNGRITYEINAENVDVDLLEIPPMIIQPYVENAIHHGLEPKQGEGHIMIKFKEVNKHLICVVEDDGVGRMSKMVLKDRNIYKRKSLSTDINEERLSISDDSVEIVDLMEQDGSPRGTQVNIYIKITHA